MRVLLVGYLLITAGMLCFVGGECLGKRHALAAGTLGILLACLGACLAWSLLMKMV